MVSTEMKSCISLQAAEQIRSNSVFLTFILEVPCFNFGWALTIVTEIFSGILQSLEVRICM